MGAAHASGITLYKQDGQFAKLGGRIQMQYHQKDDKDKIFLRRFRLYVEGSLYKDWKGKFQWEMGKAKEDDEFALKSAYFQYTGFGGGKIHVGNSKSGFSREWMISSKKQQLIERSFVGDPNYGIPGYMLGVRFDGYAADKRVTYILSAGSMSLDPDDGKLDFDTPVNDRGDWNQGWAVAGRLDYHPFGYQSMSQGDLKGKQGLTLGLGAFSWSNDGDNNKYIKNPKDGMADVDSANGVEISAGYRNAGFSVDAQYNLIKAGTVDGGYNGGIFKNGETTITQMALEGGYMVVPARLELVAGIQSMEADGYSEAWTRNSVGINWFLRGHDIKVQLSYRQGENLFGKDADDKTLNVQKDKDELFLQAQYVF